MPAATKNKINAMETSIKEINLSIKLTAILKSEIALNNLVTYL